MKHSLDFTKKKLLKGIEVYNVNGTLNRNGSITEQVETSLELNGRHMKERFLVTALGTQRVILGYPWLEKVKPKINWKKKTFSWWDDDEEDQPNIYALLCKVIESNVYEATKDLVISYLGMMQHEINDQWILE